MNLVLLHGNVYRLLVMRICSEFQTGAVKAALKTSAGRHGWIYDSEIAYVIFSFSFNLVVGNSMLLIVTLYIAIQY